MLLDSYFVPLLEILLSVIIPLLLTLKSLQLTQSSSDHEYSKFTITFWLIYWLVLFFLELANVNYHFRTIFTLYYFSQNRKVMTLVLNFYRNTLLPFGSRTLLASFNIKMSEDELDSKIGILLYKVCFDTELVKKIVSLFTNSAISNTINSSGTSRSRNVSSRATSGSHFLDNPKDVGFVPLDVPKHRNNNHQDTGKKSRNSSSYSLNNEQKSFKKAAWSRNVSMDSQSQDDIGLFPSSSHEQLHSKLHGTNTNIDSKKSFREEIKNIFIG